MMAPAANDRHKNDSFQVQQKFGLST